MNFWYLKINIESEYLDFMDKICIDYSLDYIRQKYIHGILYENQTNNEKMVLLFDIYSKIVLTENTIRYMDLLKYNIKEIRISKITNEDYIDIISVITFMNTTTINKKDFIFDFFLLEFDCERCIIKDRIKLINMIESLELSENDELIYLNEFYDRENILLSFDLYKYAKKAFIHVFMNSNIIKEDLIYKLSLLELRKIFLDLINKIKNDENDIYLRLDDILSIINNTSNYLNIERIEYDNDLTYSSSIFLKNKTEYFDYNNYKIPTSGNNIEFLDKETLENLLFLLNKNNKFKYLESKVIEKLSLMD